MSKTDEHRKENEGSSTHTNVPRTEEERKREDGEKRAADGEFESSHKPDDHK